MKRPPAEKQLSFQSKLERISDELEYFGIPVPAKITLALGTKGPVPVMATVNNSKPFLISLYPVGGGRHNIRVKAEIRKATKIKEGDRVRVQITVRDRTAEVSIPKDLMSALKAEGVLKDFEAVPNGQKSFILRRIDEAAKPETREKRIQAAVEAAHKRREK
ncbi:MAG: YdeI/OmpD-associated family protein [Bdellovibrionia bacterium]